MALQAPGDLLETKDKWEEKEIKEISGLRDQEVMLEIEDHEE